MVYTKIKDIAAYASLHPRFPAAFDALKKYASVDTPDGHYVIDGDNLFVNVDTYETADKKTELYEQHHKYIDIQYIVSGKETIKAINLDDALISEEYKEERECAFYVPAAGVASFGMTDGDALILFPTDPHCPGLPLGNTSFVKKIIVKVKID